MRKYRIRLYPVELHLVSGNHGNARVTIATPSNLPLWELWMSAGASLYALSEAYATARELLSPESEFGDFTRDEDGRISFHRAAPHIIGDSFSRDENGLIVFSPTAPSEPVKEMLRGDLRIARFSYNSPINIDLIVNFLAAFSLVAAVTAGAVTATIEILEWREKRSELEDEGRKRDLEIERLMLEIEARRRELAKPVATQSLSQALSLTEPETVLVERLSVYANVLSGEEEVWTSYLH